MSESQTLRQGACAVVAALRASGFEALWAGGCVRDQVMGRVPGDYDIATSASPQEVVDVFERTVPIGAQFGVVLVVLDEARHYEVATFRTEGGYRDGRRPDQVQWASAYEDVIRRDFTINGLLYDPVADKVIDHVGGVQDIRRGLVRAIGRPSERFSEDRLRMLRAIRFAARFGFQLDDATYDAICQHAPGIGDVSVERIAGELDRIMTGPDASRGLSLLLQTGLLSLVLPELEHPADAIARFRGEVCADSVLAWSLLLADLAPEKVVDATRRLKMSRNHQKTVGGTVALSVAFRAYDAVSIAQRKRMLRDTNAGHALSVAGRGAEAGQWEPSTLKTAADDAQAWSEEDLFPPSLLDGRDLANLGLIPGPRFKLILTAIEDAQLAGTMATREEAERLARTMGAHNTEESGAEGA